MRTKFDFWSVVTSRVFFSIAAVVLLVIVIGVVRSIVRRVEIQREVTALQQDIKALEGKNEELRRAIGYFNTPEFKEREARLRLGLQKPGENVVVIPNLDAAGTDSNAAAAAAVELPNWRRWLNYFFGR